MTEEYEELYAYIHDYYDYLYDLTEQAAEEIDYLLSLLPTLEEMQGVEESLQRLENLPKGGKFRELSVQLSRDAQQALSGLKGTQPPSGMEAYGSKMEALAQELASLTREMAGALSAGNEAAFSALAGEMNATVVELRQRLCASVNSLPSSYTSALSQLEAAIESALP